MAYRTLICPNEQKGRSLSVGPRSRLELLKGHGLWVIVTLS